MQTKKNANPEGLVCAVWWWGGYRVKRLVVQEVRAADNVCGMMGITAKSGLHIHKNGAPEVIESSDGRLTLSVPIQFKRRAGRKLITLPNGESGEPRPWGIALTALQLALARGHRWLAMLESGKVSSLREIASQEGVDNSYVSRMVNLTVLAPDIVEAILDDSLPDHLTLFDIAVDPPALWEGQRTLLISLI